MQRQMNRISLKKFLLVVVLIYSVSTTYHLRNAFATPNSSTQQSLIHDKSLGWSASIQRHWLRSPNKERYTPPAMLLLTTVGWNSPDQMKAQKLYRGIRYLELIQGVIRHPWFHPTAWQDLNSGKMVISSNSTRYYVFLDRDSCIEKNYPNYNHGFVGNRDPTHGLDEAEIGGWNLDVLRKVLHTPLLLSGRATLIIFDCGGWGPRKNFLKMRRTEVKKENPNKLAVVSLSATLDQLQPQDQGLPPPACQPYSLSSKERDNITSCESEVTRRTLLSFSGKLHSSQARKELAKLHGGGIVKIVKTGVIDKGGKSMHKLLLDTVFAAAPRGDNLFSYRFTEVMSAGAIPVIIADNWRLPFGDDLIDWTNVAVTIPESKVNETIEVLQSIPRERRCNMRKQALHIYETYMKDGSGIVKGVIEQFENAAQRLNS